MIQTCIEIFKRALYLLIIFAPLIILQFVLSPEDLSALQENVQNYFLLYVITVFLLKTLSIVYPPLPGVTFTLTSVPIIGWQYSYLIDLAGSTTGAIIAYLLGKKYGKPILKSLFGEKIFSMIDKVRLREGKQLEAAIVLRLASSGLSDALAWIASTVGFRLSPFIIGFVIAHILTTPIFFYLVEKSINYNSGFIIGIIAVSTWVFIYRFKGRYFE